ncbi:uncharacterized protein [Aegilops tauschii subsp. strangulata]|uniref:non-specific serine/threonine protein kinase n=1 Tax=Aegilops tauschii TaxID=37682 RepID=N1QS34_AEGTA
MFSHFWALFYIACLLLLRCVLHGNFQRITKNNCISLTFTTVEATSLYRCASLRHLDLSYNYLKGELPAGIGRALGANLTSLMLNGNYFTGTIPTSLSRLQNLRSLELDNNYLAGTIPPELGALRGLQTLTLGYNSFGMGELPASFKNLTKLKILQARSSNLTSDFPSYVTEMSELGELGLSINALTGSIPPGHWNLTKLRFLTVYANNLTGEVIIDDGAFGVLNLVTIDLSADHKLSEPIPKAVAHLPKLQTLNLFYNNFSGQIPEGLCENGKLEYLNVGQNILSGSIPASLAGCATLKRLILSNNKLSGNVPSFF